MSKNNQVPSIPFSVAEDFPVSQYFRAHGFNHLRSIMGESGLLDLVRDGCISSSLVGSEWFTLNSFGASLCMQSGFSKTLSMKAGLLTWVILDSVKVDIAREVCDSFGLDKSGIFLMDGYRVIRSNFGSIKAGNINSMEDWINLSIHSSMFCISLLLLSPVEFDNLFYVNDKVLETVSGRVMSEFAKVFYSKCSDDTRARIRLIVSSLYRHSNGKILKPGDIDKLAGYNDELPIEMLSFDKEPEPEPPNPEEIYKLLVKNMKDWDDEDFWNEMTNLYNFAKSKKDIKLIKQILELKGKAMGALEMQQKGMVNNFVMLTNEAMSTLSKLGLANKKVIEQ